MSNLLHHPIYAGAYSYGRRPTEISKKIAGRPSTGRTVAPMEEWEVLMKDHYPAYIKWEEYESNLRQLQSNTHQAKGVVRQGPSLLSGILICGQCGLKMAAHYNNNATGLRYSCYTMKVNYAQDSCQSLEGTCLEHLIEEWLLKALQPSAIEVSLKVAEEIEEERKQLDRHWKQRLERANYQTKRAFRQYNAAEPENRLVVRTLESQWEIELQQEKELQQEYQRFLREHPQKLSLEQKQAIEELSKNIPQLWKAPTTQSIDKQRIVRQMIERIIVTVEGQSEKVHVQIHWIGGDQTNARCRRPVAKLEQLSYYSEMLQTARQLAESGHQHQEIAQILNHSGFKPAKRAKTFNAQMVSSLLGRRGKAPSGRFRPSEHVEKYEHEWTVNELAIRLEMTKTTLHSWIFKGKMKTRKTRAFGRLITLVEADEKELSRLEQLKNATPKWVRHIRVD